MRVIICGAGQVGYSIASYLAREDNDITVIDLDPHLIAEINNDLDVNAIQGHAAHPDVLQRAGADEADMLIAVTHSDEVNMVACEVAHALFNVPKKIARVRSQAYLDPAWSNLFARSHMPIDVIISPEREVAHVIEQRLASPGTSNIVSLAEDKIQLIGVICQENCPIVNTQLKQIGALFPSLSLRIGMILRQGKLIIPNVNDQMEVGDEVYFFVETPHVKRALAVFGHEETEARHIVIMGGGNIGLNLAHLLQEESGVHVKIIEHNEDRARMLSETFPNMIILNGDGLDQDILEEANVARTETLIAVTNDDETNILGSLLAKQYGCRRVITLVNKPTYTTLLSSLGIDAVVSPRASTVSRIMQYVRRGRIKALHTLRDGHAEVIEAEVSETSFMANKPLRSLNMPKDVMVGGVVRGDEILTLDSETIIRPGDRVIVLAAQEQARKVEKMFTVQVDLF